MGNGLCSTTDSRCACDRSKRHRKFETPSPEEVDKALKELNNLEKKFNNINDPTTEMVNVFTFIKTLFMCAVFCVDCFTFKKIEAHIHTTKMKDETKIEP